METNEIYIRIWAALGFILPVVWLLILKLKFNPINKIHDSDGVILPSVLMIICPFAFPLIYLNFSGVADYFKPFIPLITFFLGQLFESHRREEEDRKSRRIYASQIGFNLFELIAKLYVIENNLTKIIENNFDEVIENSQAFVAHTDELYSQVKSTAEIHKFEYGNQILTYLIVAAKEVDRLLSHQSSGSFHKPSDWLPTIRDLYIKLYKLRLSIIRDITKEHQLMETHLLELEKYKLKLQRLRDAKIRNNNEFRKKSELSEDIFDSNSNEINAIKAALKALERLFQEFDHSHHQSSVVN